MTSQGYEYISVHNEAALISNLRKQLELLNDFTFTDSEWERFFKECIANTNEGTIEKLILFFEKYFSSTVPRHLKVF